MTFTTVFRAVVVACAATAALAESECEQRCRYVRNDMNAQKSGACANERRALPRPKLGNACMSGFSAGFDDACVTMCEGNSPKKNQGLACKPFRTDMPKPTTMRSCGTGYGKGFEFGKQEGAGGLTEEAKPNPKDTLKPPPGLAAKGDKKGAAPKTPPPKKEPPAAPKEAPAAPEAAPAAVEEKAAPTEAAAEPVAPPAAEDAPAAADGPEPIFQMPVTVDDADVPLKIFANEDPEEVVIAFCAEHMADAGESCSRQLLPHVLKKMEEFENSVAGIDGAEEQ